MKDRPLTTSRVAERQPGDESLPDPIVVLFDVDGTLISTGGAGARSWRWAFEELHGIPADIGEHSEAGMTDPVVGRSTFRNALHRDPTQAEMRSLLAAYVERLPTEVQASERYRVLPGAEDVLRSLHATGRVTGIVTGALEEASRIKLARGDLNRFLPFGGFGSDSADRVELTRRAIERGAALIRRELPPERVHVLGDTPRGGVGARRTHSRDRCSRWSSDRRCGGAGRGARVEDSKGSGCRIRTGSGRSRRSSIERHPGGCAALRPLLSSVFEWPTREERPTAWHARARDPEHCPRKTASCHRTRRRARAGGLGMGARRRSRHQELVVGRPPGLGGADEGGGDHVVEESDVIWFGEDFADSSPPRRT